MSNPVDSFFGGAPGLSWPRATNGVYQDTALLGVIRGGVIVEPPELQNRTEMGSGKPMTWGDGRPKQQAIVTLLCDGSRGGARDERDRTNAGDTGRRKLYIKSYMVAAIREALSSAGVTGLQVGGELYVAWTGQKESSVKGGDPARLWQARYIAPTTAIPDGYAQAQPQGTSPAADPWGTPSQQPAPAQAAPQNPFGGDQVTGPPATQPQDPWGAAPALAQQQTANPWG